MKRRSFSVLTIFVAGICLAVSGFTGPSEALSHHKYKVSSSDAIPNRYIVEFDDGDSVSAFSFVHSVQSKFKQAKVHIAEQFNHDLFNGISFGLNGLTNKDHSAALKTILDHNNVKAVYPVRIIKRPNVNIESTSFKGNAHSILPHEMTQVDRVHSELKKFGKGVKIGVIDSGVDYMHPALGGGFGKGFKVQYGYDLVGSAYTGDNSPVPDTDPLDSCTAGSGASGHGTHVSGIIAGYDAKTNFTGVAPQATLGMWRVFGCVGYTTDDIMLKAFLMAYDAGMDVISVSIGETNAWSNGPHVAVAQRISEKGIPFVISAGNSGDLGAFTVGIPSTAKDVWSIASVNNAYHQAKMFKASSISKQLVYMSPSSAMIDGTIVAGDKNMGHRFDGCKSSTVPDLKGKLALVQRGVCSVNEVAANVVKAGAIGLVFFNEEDDSAYLPNRPKFNIPVAGISTTDGLAILAGIKAGPMSLKFDSNTVAIPTKAGYIVSSFSSIGATNELDLKPNLAGVGGGIYSTLPRYRDSWGMMSGTSMAAPYVSGSIALFIEATGIRKNNNIISQKFKNHARKLVHAKGKSAVESPLLQGAGLVQVYDAIVGKVLVSPTQISFNDTSSFDKYKTQTLTIHNTGNIRTTFKIINEPSIAISPYNRSAYGYRIVGPTGFISAKARLTFSKTFVTLNAGQNTTVRVTVIPPKVNPKDHIMYGGYIRLKTGNQKIGFDVTVPYFGVVGRQRDLPIFDVDYPFLSDKETFKVYLKNQTYIFDRSNSTTTPTIVYRLLTPTAKFDVDVFNVKTKKIIGKTMTDSTYLIRNYFEDYDVSSIPWDATYVPSDFSGIQDKIPVSSGTYILKLRALKLLGNPNNSKDWEPFQTGPIVVRN
ncbi:peptidase S8/S53 domain-containing protein [Phycomyces nitens]|nr:peptidase S8/S53 domain-containing protein [Phycomyces nitens]